MKEKRFWICLALLLAWIIFIFCRSLKPADVSTSESQRVLDLLQRLCPFKLSMHLVRKLAHFTEFAVLGLLAGMLFGGAVPAFAGWPAVLSDDRGSYGPV